MIAKVYQLVNELGPNNFHSRVRIGDPRLEVEYDIVAISYDEEKDRTLIMVDMIG